MRVLLTGATGFVGRAIATQLVSSGHEIEALHTHANPSLACRGVSDVLSDVSSADAVRRLSREVESCEAIIHAAASLDMNLFAGDVCRVNCIGLQNMLWLADNWRCSKFVFLSSVRLIGTPEFMPVTEDHPVDPPSAYHASKLFGEQLVTLAQAHGVVGINLRLTAPVGPGIPQNRFLAVLVSRALNNDPIEIRGNGTRKQDYVDIRDIALAVQLCLSRDASGVFNVASGACISNLDLARRCIALCNSTSELVFSGGIDPEEGFSWNVSIEKAGNALGYIPRFDINDAIMAAIDDSRRNTSSNK